MQWLVTDNWPTEKNNYNKLTTLFDSIKFQLILGNMINFALIYCHCLEQFNSFV